MYALVLTRKVAKTAPAMAVGFMEGYHLPYGKIMAISTLIVIPVIVFALIASKHLVRGLTMGTVNIVYEAASLIEKETPAWQMSNVD